MAEVAPTICDNKSCKTYFLVNDSKVYFTGDFDSGNLQKVQQLSLYTYRVTPGFDKTSQSTKKNFFYFRTFGFKQCRVKFQITRVFLLQHLIRSDESSNAYHPVVKKLPSGEFQKITKNVKIYYNLYDEPELSFYFDFSNEQQAVEFAFTYPYSYQDNQKLLAELSQRYNSHSEIYFHQETICRTRKGRSIDVVTITNMCNCKEDRAQKIQGLYQNSFRPFQINRPTIVFSARVHPGQSPSSYCIQGVLRFLLNQKDPRSAQLRKHFQFIIIPMINPDGVYEGMFRNSPNGFNLNRLYKNCNPKENIQIWSIVQYVNSLQRVDFFFDLHSHPSNKPFFIYGNSFQSFIQQVEAQLFGKFLQNNCPYFENLESIFSQKAMKAKEKYDNYGKQGCARVYYHKKFKLIHSYTVQCGYFAPSKLQDIQKYRDLCQEEKGSYSFDWQQCSMEEYQPQNYMLLGKSLLISILDLFQINPFPRLSLSDVISIKNMRKTIAQKIYNQDEKFKQLQVGNYKKIKQISDLIHQKYYKSRFQHFGLSIQGSSELKAEFLRKESQVKIAINKKRLPTMSNISIKKLKPSNVNLNDLHQSQVATGRTENEINNPQSQAQATEYSENQANVNAKIITETIHHKLLQSFQKYERRPNVITFQKNTKITKSLINVNLKTTQRQKLNEIRISGRSSNSHLQSKQEKISSKLRYIEDQGIKRLIKSKMDDNIRSFIKLKTSPFQKVEEKQKKLLANSSFQLPNLRISYKNNTIVKLKTEQV